MLKNKKNSKIQGTVGMGSAVQYFTSMGWIVSLPLNDSQKYDLIFDAGAGALKKVQVKTTTCQNRYGSWIVGLRTTGGNQSFYTAKPFDGTAVDYLYILAEDGSRWFIPTKGMKNTRGIDLGHKYSRWKL